METMEKLNKTNFKMDSTNIEKSIINTLDKIKRYAEFMDYKIIGDLSEVGDLSSKISDLSLSQKKKLRNLLLKANYHMSLRQINKFLHFLYKNVLKSDKRVNIKVSEKEIEIQKRRKEWVNARKKSDAALFIYKNTKGDFYKNEMKKSELVKTM